MSARVRRARISGTKATPRNAPERSRSRANCRRTIQKRMRTSTRRDYEDRITAAVDLALSSLDHSITPADLADAAGFSRFHFGRIFSAALGESIAEFTRRLRLERAAAQLTSTNRTVGEIAIDAGYSVEAFTRAFRAGFLMSPSEFRKNQPDRDLQRERRSLGPNRPAESATSRLRQG